MELGKKKYFLIWVLMMINWFEIRLKWINFRVVECFFSNYGNF